MTKRAMRNPNGFGSVHKLSGNRRKPWRVRITKGWTEEGKQIFENIGYYATRPEAMIALAKYNENPWDIKNTTLTYADVFEMWRKKNVDTMEMRNLRDYTNAFNQTEKYHSTIFINLKTVHIENMIKEIKSYSTKRRCKILFSQLYKFALENDICNKNYSEFVKIPVREETKEKIPFTMKEIESVFKQDELYFDIVKILLFSGFRIGELLNLKTKDIDLKERIMIGGSKTKAGKNRRVPISKHIHKIIEKLYNPNNEFLLIDSDKSKVNYQRVWKWWQKNIKNHTIHETRHTFITICSYADCNKLSVQNIVGHASQDITDDIYTHKNNEALVKTIDKLDKYVCTVCVL